MPHLMSIRGFNQRLSLNTSFQSTVAGDSSSSSLNELESKSQAEQQKSKGFLTIMWNPVLFAIYNNQLEVVKFLMSMDKPYTLNKKLVLYQSPFQQEDSHLPELESKEHQCLALLIAVSNKRVDILSYLLNEHNQIWKAEHLRIVVREIYCSWSTVALGKVLESKAFSKVIEEMDSIEE